MPKIQFTKADVLRSQNLENEKWYSWIIKQVVGPKPNKAGDGYNYEVVFSLIDQAEDLNGKEITRTYSNKAISMMIPLTAAVRGKKLDEMPKEDFDFDTDELVGKKVDGKHTLETYEGRLTGKVETYAPYKSITGSASSAGAPFQICCKENRKFHSAVQELINAAQQDSLL